MRTDSVNLSDFATIEAKSAITKMMGENYVHPRHFETKTKGAQKLMRLSAPPIWKIQTIEGSAQEKKLYDLIWKRTHPSQMADAELEKTTATISISGNKDVFTATGEVIKFDGFLHVYRESYDDDNEQEDEKPLITSFEKRPATGITALSSQPNGSLNARHATTEASLVRKLEELGFGRPSTYLRQFPLSNNANM